MFLAQSYLNSKSLNPVLNSSETPDKIPVDWDVKPAVTPFKSKKHDKKQHKEQAKKQHKKKSKKPINAEKYVEPTEQEMKALYDDVPREKDYKGYGDEIIVLPISLKQFRKLWYDDNGPLYADKFMAEKSEKNIIKKASKWHKPSSEQNRSFQGEKCVLQRDQEWSIYANILY